MISEILSNKKSATRSTVPIVTVINNDPAREDHSALKYSFGLQESHSNCTTRQTSKTAILFSLNLKQKGLIYTFIYAVTRTIIDDPLNKIASQP